MRLALADLDVHANGAFSSTRADTEVEAKASGLTAHATGVTWLREAAVDLDLAAVLDLETGGITLGDTRLTLNALPLRFAGSVVPEGDDLDLDLTWEAADTSFKALLSLVPAVFLSGFDDVKTDGTMAASGSVKGRYAAEGDHIPAFDVALSAKDAWFQYPSLPRKVSSIALDARVHHPEGATDLTEVDIDRMHLEIGEAPVDVKLKLRHPTTDPFLDTTVKAKVDLGVLSQAVEGIDTTGKLDADFAVKGRMSDFEAQRVDAIEASGGVKARDLTYTSEALPYPILFHVLDLAFSPQRAEVKQMELTTGPTDAAITGDLDNLWPWMLAEKPLRGDIEVASRTLDLRPFQGEPEEGTPADDTEPAIVPVPTDLDMRVGCTAKRVYLDDMELTDLVTKLQVKEGVAELQTLTAGFTGGTVSMHGTYAAPTTEKADVDFTVDSVRLDAAKTVSTFDSLTRIAPVLKGTQGTFGSGLQLKARLLSDLSLDLPALVSSGNLRDLKVVMKPSLLGEVARQLKDGSLSDVDLVGTVVKWNIEGGRMKLAPIAMKLGNTPATLSGSTGVVDQTLDLVLALPVSTQALQGGGKLGKVAKDVGTVDVMVRITGTYDKPRIGIDVGDGVKEAVEDAVKEVVDEVKDDALDKASDLIDAASAEGDRLIAAAEKAAAAVRSEAARSTDKIRKEASKQGDKLIAAAKNPVAKAAAQESAKALDKEADKSAKKVESEADKKADGLVAEARKQKEKLIADARKKVDAQR